MPSKSALTGGRWVTIEHEHVYIKSGAIVAGHVPSDKKSVDKAVDEGHASRMFKPDSEVRPTSTSLRGGIGKHDEWDQLAEKHVEHGRDYLARKDLSESDREAISKVNGGGSDYRNENKKLRQLGATTQPEEGSDAAIMQRAVLTSPETTEDQVLYRHFRHDPNHLAGEEVNSSGFMSTAAVSHIAYMDDAPGQNFGYEIAVPKGSKGVMFGQVYELQEGTFSHGSRFKVLGKKQLQYKVSSSNEITPKTRTIYQLAYLGPGSK